MRFKPRSSTFGVVNSGPGKRDNWPWNWLSLEYLNMICKSLLKFNVKQDIWRYGEPWKIVHQLLFAKQRWVSEKKIPLNSVHNEKSIKRALTNRPTKPTVRNSFYNPRLPNAIYYCPEKRKKRWKGCVQTIKLFKIAIKATTVRLNLSTVYSRNL